MRWAVLQFPGSNCDQDCVHVLRHVLGQEVEVVWHKEASLGNAEAVIVPGGFSYGDYLRCGAIARFSPVMKAVIDAANAGKPVIGICNGFQILCEAGLLPGVLLRNRGLQFRCHMTHLRVENADSLVTRGYEKGQVLRIPIAHGDGNYFADEATLADLKQHNQILFTYCDAAGNTADAANPNGAQLHIAGIMNRAGNVVGLMPHPERAAEKVLGSTDGRAFFESVVTSFAS